MDSSEALSIIKRCAKLCDLILNGPASSQYEWLMNLGQSLKTSVTTPMNITFGFTPGSRGNHAAHSNSVPQFLTLLRDALLHLRYEEASEYLLAIITGCRTNLPLALETAVHRSGLEIMYHVENSHTTVPLNEFNTQLKNLNSAINPQQVVMEQFFHLLTSGQLTEAIECIKSLPKPPRNATGTKRSAVAVLFRAYRGLASFFEWEVMYQKWRLSESTSTFGQSDQLEELAEKALGDLSTVNGDPGVWDMFICNQVQLLVYFRRVDEAYRVLADYKSVCGDNPNSHRYLIDFMKQYRTSDDDALAVALKEYCVKWPSDKTMVVELLSRLNSDDTADQQLKVTTFFALCDFSCHQYDVSVWTTFRDFLQTAVSETSSADIADCLRTEWHERESWWTKYHFNFSQGDCSPDLVTIKSQIRVLLKSASEKWKNEG